VHESTQRNCVCPRRRALSDTQSHDRVLCTPVREACCGASSLEPAPFLGGTFLQLKAEAAGGRGQHGAHSRLCRRGPPPAVAATVVYRQPCRPPCDTRPGHLAAERVFERQAARETGHSAPAIVLAVLIHRSSLTEGMAGGKLSLRPAGAHARQMCVPDPSAWHRRLLGRGAALGAPSAPRQSTSPSARRLVREPPKQQAHSHACRSRPHARPASAPPARRQPAAGVAAWYTGVCTRPQPSSCHMQRIC